MQYRAGECRTQTVAEDRNLSPRPVWRYEEVGGGTQGRRLGQTEASDNQWGSMRIQSPRTWPTVRRRKANALRVFPPVSYEKEKTVVERERRKGTQKRYEHFRRSLERARTVERGRNKHPTERRGGKRVSPATCPTAQELSSRLSWKQESTG